MVKNEHRKAMNIANKILREYITDDVFPPGYPKAKKQWWKKKPLQSLLISEKNRNWYGTKLNSQGRTRSIPARLIMKMRGEDVMENLNNELKRHPQVTLSEELQLRAKALANEDKIKKSLLKESEKQGWVGLTLKEVDYDMDRIYNKVLKKLDSSEEIGRDEIKLIDTLRSIRSDKVDLQKFMLTHEMKKEELQMKKEDRKKEILDVGNVRLD